MRAVAIFVGSALGVAVSGIAVILWAQSGGDFDPEVHTLFIGGSALLFGFIVFVAGALIVAIVAVRRRQLVEWLAGYAGVMVGIVSYWILFDRFSSQASVPMVDPLAGLVVLAAPTAGLIFLVVGMVRLLQSSTPPGTAGPSGGAGPLW